MQNRYSNLIKGLSISERSCALILGVIFLLVGIAGFIPGLITLPVGAPNTIADAPRLVFDDGYGHVLGLFPTNFLHNAVHIAVGILGIAASTSLGGALVFNQGFAIAYTAIAIMGLIPFTNTTFGVMPIYGNNVWFNALTALIAAYVGFIKPTEIANAEAPPSSPTSA